MSLMGSLKDKLTLLLLLLFLYLGASKADWIGDFACTIVDCGQGICNGSADKPPFSYECECNPGWTQFMPLGPFTPCTVPNCTLNLDCALPQLPPLTIPTNFTDPCALTWCGNGTCAQNGTGGHECVCADGAYNLLNLTSMPCFQECYLGAGCQGATLRPPPPPAVMPTPPGTSPGTSAAPSPKNYKSGSYSKMKWIGASAYSTLLIWLQFVI